MKTARQILRDAMDTDPCGDCMLARTRPCMHGAACWVKDAREYLATPETNAERYGLDPRAAHAAWEASGSRKAFSDWLLSPAQGE